MKTLISFLALAASAASAAAQDVVNLDTSETFATIQAAIDDTDTLDGHTLEMLVGLHAEGPQISFTKDLTLRGSGLDTLNTTANTGTSGDARAWILTGYGTDVTFENLRFDGSGFLVYQGIRNHGTLTVRNCEFTEIKYNESGPNYSGIALGTFDATGLLTVSDCSFSEIGRIGIHVFEPALVERVTYTGKGAGDWLDYFMCIDSFGASVADATVRDCTISGCRGIASSDGSASGGILITTFFGAGTLASIESCSVSDCILGINIGFDSADTSDVTISNCSVFDNDFGVVNTSSTNSIDATNNWWGDSSGPEDLAGTFEADNPDCYDSDFVGALDVINADGLGDSVEDGNVDYCPWLLVAPPCISVPVAASCGILTASLEGPDLADHNNILVVHYNAGVTEGTASIANVAFLELRSAQFASSQTLPDPENYALNLVLPVPTSDGSNLPPALTTLDSMSTDFGEPGFGGLPALWTIDYYNGVNSPGDLAGARTHTVLFGAAPTGVCDLVQTFASPTEQFAQSVFEIEGGIYHSITNPEVDLTSATAWDGSAFTIPVPGAQAVRPYLYAETHSIDIGNDTTPALLTGSADPGFVTVWRADYCTTDTLASVATNRLGLEVVDAQTCYTEDDLVEVELHMSCLGQDVSGFFASVSFDPSVLQLQASSAYTLSPFPLHVSAPITASVGGTILLDGSVNFGGAGTSADALLATLVFKVLAGNDGASTGVSFTSGGAFPNELSFEGSPVATRTGDPLEFSVDQVAPSIVCEANIVVSNDPGLCSAALVLVEPTTSDACGLVPVAGVRSDALALDDPYPAGCAPGQVTTITWTATDCAGLTNSCVQTVTVVDDEDPVLVGVPANIAIVADAGGCSAVVTFTDPTATDNCDPTPGVVCVPPSGSVFPSGITTVTCTATDACSNFSVGTFDVEVQPVNEVVIEVELVGVSAPTSRCIHFVGDDCTDTADATLSFTDHDSNALTPVRAIATIQIPCGTNTSLCVKDEQHTLWSSTTLTPVGTQYVADSLVSLEGGDTDNDGDVDINDVTWFIFQYGSITVSGGCPYDGTTRDADFNDGGAIGSEDYTFLTANFLSTSGCACTQPLPGDGQRGRFVKSLPVRSAREAALDFDGNGRIDHKDVRRFETRNGLPHTLSERLRLADR